MQTQRQEWLEEPAITAEKAQVSKLRIPRAILQSARPRQWPKNFVLLAAIIFSGHLGVVADVVHTLVALVAFCCVSSGVYIFNDVADVEKDRLHHIKRLRPIAANILTVPVASASGIGFLVAGLGFGYVVSPRFALVTAAYLAIQLAYTFYLKDVAYFEIATVALGFMIRAIAGAIAIDVYFSGWLVACMGLLAVFLILGKRRHEIMLLDAQARLHRSVLGKYTVRLIDALLALSMVLTLLAYALYATTSKTAQGHRALIATIPFVVTGILRYRHLIFQRNLGGAPEEVLWNDPTEIASILGWLVVSALAMMWS